MIKPREGTFAFSNEKGLVEGFKTPLELTKKLRTNPDLSLIRDPSKIKYTVSDINGFDTKTLSGEEAEKAIRSKKYNLISSEWDDDESAFKTGAKSFAKELTFGLVKPRSKEFYSKSGLKVLEEERKKDASFSHGVGSVAGFVGGGFGAVPKLAVKAAQKFGLKGVATAAKAFDISNVAGKAGQFAGKFDNLLGAVGKAKLTGRAAELAAYSAPYAIAAGIDNKDVKATTNYMATSLAIGGGLEIGLKAVGGPIARAAGRVASPIKGLVGKGVELTAKGSQKLSTVKRESYFNLRTAEGRADFLKGFTPDRVKNIVKDMDIKNKNSLATNFGKPITAETYKTMNNDEKLKVITTGLRTYDKTVTQNVWKGFDLIQSRIKDIGNKIGELRKEAVKAIPSKPLIPGEKVSNKSDYFGADKFLKQIQNQESVIHKNLQANTPDGKKILGALGNVRTEVRNARIQILSGSSKFQSILKKVKKEETDITEIIKTHQSKKLSMETALKETTKAREKQFAEVVKKASSKDLKGKSFFLTDDNLNINYNKLAEFHEKHIQALLPKQEKFLKSLKELEQTNVSLGYNHIFRLRDSLDNIINKQGLEKSPILNTLRKQFKQKEKDVLTYEKNLKNSIIEQERNLSYNKHLSEMMKRGKKEMSEIQGMSLSERGSKVLIGGSLGAVGLGSLFYAPAFTIPIAALAVGTYALTPYFSSRGIKSMQAADFFERFAARMLKSKQKHATMKTPKGLRKFMQSSRSVRDKTLSPFTPPPSYPTPPTTRGSGITMNAIGQLFDIGDMKEDQKEKKKPDDQALMDIQENLVNGVYEQGVGTADLSIDFMQNINEDYSPALDAEKQLFKEKVTDLVNQFMPEEIKMAVAERQKPSITKWKLDRFRENVTVGLNPMTLYDHVKNNTLTYQHIQAVQMVNPEAYQEIALNLLENEEALDYNQKKELKKIMNEKGGFHVLAKGPMEQPEANNKNKVSRKVDTADFLPIQESARLG